MSAVSIGARQSFERPPGGRGVEDDKRLDDKLRATLVKGRRYAIIDPNDNGLMVATIGVFRKWEYATSNIIVNRPDEPKNAIVFEDSTEDNVYVKKSSRWVRHSRVGRVTYFPADAWKFEILDGRDLDAFESVLRRDALYVEKLRDELDEHLGFKY